MTDEANCNKTKLTAFPGYTCYLLDVKGCFRPTQGSFDKDEVRVSWLWTWSNPYYTGTGTVIPKGSMNCQLSTCVCIKPEDNIIIHPSINVPKKLISCGTPINDKSTNVATKIVIPQDFWVYARSKYRSMVNVVILINESCKTVFAIDAYVYGSEKIGGTEPQWIRAMAKDPDLYQDFGTELYGFKMPYGTKEFSIFYNMSDIDIAIASGMLPKDVVVHETHIETGTEPVTVDLLYSVYMMLESPDTQIVETAYNMLAQSKFNERKELIRWILKPYRRNASAYKSKSTAFRWLYDSCDCYNRCVTTLCYSNQKMAKELINRITKGDIHWDDEDNMISANPKWFADSHLRELIQAVKQDEHN